jgi:hypothetical protein
MDQHVERVQTNISESQMAAAIIAAWKELFEQTPCKEQVSMILAHNNLETGSRKHMFNYNVGNITHTNGDGFDFWSTKDWHWDQQHTAKVFYGAKFRSYPSLEAGVKDYIKLLSGKYYSSAWQHIVNPDPEAFSKALKAKGYYATDEKEYTAGIKSLFAQANKTDSYGAAMSGQIAPTMQASTTPAATQSIPPTLMRILQQLNQELTLAANHSLKQLYKRALPNNAVLITIDAPDYTSAIEFSRVLCAALDENLLSTSYPHTDGTKVEVECMIPGPAEACIAAVQDMTDTMADVFKSATKQIGGIQVKASLSTDKTSSLYQPLSAKTACTNYRMFQLKFATREDR